MVLTKEQIKELEEVSKPLMKFLSDNFHPHIKVIVESNTVEILEGSAMVRNDDYTID
jgi:hypothetical protein